MFNEHLASRPSPAPPTAAVFRNLPRCVSRKIIAKLAISKNPYNNQRPGPYGVMAKGSANNFRRKIRCRIYDFARTRTYPNALYVFRMKLNVHRRVYQRHCRSAIRQKLPIFRYRHKSLSVEYQLQTRFALRFVPFISHFHNENLIPRRIYPS